jgi:hypothetical protein
MEEIKDTIIAQFRTEDGQTTGAQLELPVNITSSQLETLINHLLKNVSDIRNLGRSILFQIVLILRND